MRRRIRAASLPMALLGTVVIGTVLAGCSGGSSSSTPTTVPTTAAATTTATAARTTVATTTIPSTPTTRARPSTSTTTVSSTTTRPRSTTTASATTTSRATTTAAGTTTTGDPAATTTPTTPDTPTTNVPAAPCDATVLLMAADNAFGPLPQGSVLTDPRCVENYASGVLTAPGQDTAFVVFDNIEGEWLGLNLGTDQICSGAQVPIEFYGPLNCGPWEG
jgi:hypothetical protein